MIEKELLKISQNLNTFTVEHFNQLRDHIQAAGFQSAAQKAKVNFNLITEESINTLITTFNKDDGPALWQKLIQREEPAVKDTSSKTTTASKNLNILPR